MIIDCHQHFWTFDPGRDAWITPEMSAIRKDFLPDDLRKVYEANGVDGGVAVQADQSVQETEFLLALADSHDFIKGVVGWIDVFSPDYILKLEAYSKYPKLKGFRHVIQGQPDEQFFSNKEFASGINRLQDYGYTYDLLVYHHQLPSAIRFTEKFPDQKFILDHCGKPDIRNGEFKKWRDNIRILARHPHTYCKLSGLVTESAWKNWRYEDIEPYLEIAAEHFGTSRLCFGSDWPVCLVAATYREVIEIISRFANQATAEAREEIFSKNAIHFYQLH